MATLNHSKDMKEDRHDDVIQKDSRFIKGKTANYTLSYGSENVFVIDVYYGDEEKRCIFKSDFYDAVCFYNRIVNGQVTPCTLQDIVLDRFGSI